MNTLFLAILVLVASVAAFDSESVPVVRVIHGVVQGSWKVSTKGRKFASFEGIPYAKPPIGDLRFKTPQPLEPWSGTKNATQSTFCLQYSKFTKQVLGSEDCLLVNVYTPTLNSRASLPVLVFIHGGAFKGGMGVTAGPNHVMDWDMVFVTFNYRLGPLGFLSTGDDVVPGNDGLKDQAFALKWVQTNILFFGGNPHNVILMGQSAGAASVHYHYLSPLSRGTFARGIALSGSAFAPWAFSKKPVQKVKSLAAILGCPTSTSQEMVDCLKKISGVDIVAAVNTMYDPMGMHFSLFKPTVEAAEVRNPFLTQHPYNASLGGAMMPAPLIVSVTAMEGLFFAIEYLNHPVLLAEIEDHWETFSRTIFEFNDTLPTALQPDVTAKIKQHYFGGKPVSLETFSELVQALGDRLFTVGVGKLASIHAQSGQPVYMFRYNFREGNCLIKYWTKEFCEVTHNDDLLYIMPIPGHEMTDPEDKKMTDVLINMIYTYSTTGIPKMTHEGSEWIPVAANSSQLNYLEISSPSKFEMKTSFDFGQINFWDSLGFKEN